MTKNYQIINNEYLNTGGHCMVNVTTVYFKPLKTTQYAYINEEWLVLSSYDYIRNELPDGMEADDFMLHTIEVENLSHEPAFDNHSMVNMPEDVAQLFFDCYKLFIREYCKYTGSNYSCKLDALPIEIYDEVSREYSHWLAENELDPVTDGYHIIHHQQYTAETEYDCNGKAAVELKQHLDNWMPANDADDKLVEDWYEEKIHIIVGGKLFTFVNGADIYNGLYDLAKYIISEQ